MSGTPKEPGAELTEDEASFASPRRQAISDCVGAFKSASVIVKGAEARINAAVADLNSLDAFTSEIGRLLRERAFHSLPELRRGRERFDGFHHLTVGPWRGIFLVSRDGAQVVGLIFSRYPHELETRLGEISKAYLAKPPEPAPAPEEAKDDDDET